MDVKNDKDKKKVKVVMFGDMPENGKCGACGGTKFWSYKYGNRTEYTCSTCHPDPREEKR